MSTTINDLSMINSIRKLKEMSHDDERVICVFGCLFCLIVHQQEEVKEKEAINECTRKIHSTTTIQRESQFNDSRVCTLQIHCTLQENILSHSLRLCDERHWQWFTLFNSISGDDNSWRRRGVLALITLLTTRFNISGEWWPFVHKSHWDKHEATDDD